MPDIKATRPNVYTASPLDRAGAKRTDEAWVAAALASPDSLFVPVWRARSLLRGMAEGRPEAVYIPGGAAGALHEAGGPWSLLGLKGETAVFAIDASHVDRPDTLFEASGAAFEDLRGTLGALDSGDAAILAHARGLMHWRVKHRFCGICGAACAPRSAGHVMHCTGCGAQHFPRTDPAVIMLVWRGDRVLLGHSQRFPRARMYSTLAGFVEPGESLEEAVAREVLEESGIACSDVQYHSSQPWPFPASIMLGFYAEAKNEEIVLDDEELLDARWFTLDELRDPAAHDFHLPRRDSIARRLIEDWMAAQGR